MIRLDLQFFGGRGASSASSSGGGGGGGSMPTSQTNNVTSNEQAQADDTTQAQAMGASYDAFMAMSDDDKADYIDQAVRNGVPVFLADNDFQKFIYNSGMNDKPQIVSDATLDSMNGTEIFRTVNNVYDQRHDISYSADQIAAQVTKGSVTRVSDTGGSVYGRGIYFASDYGDSTAYGNRRGDIKRTAVIRGKLNSNARVINYRTARQGMSAEISSRSKLGRSLSRMDTESAVSMYALAKGFNVITSGHSYINILNRNAVTMSDTYKAVGSSWN